MASSGISTSKVWHVVHHDRGNDFVASCLDSKRIHYSDMFPLPDKKEDEQFWRLLFSVGSWPLVCGRLSFIYIDQVLSCQDACEFVLLSLLLLFCPDDLLDLEERGKVEEIQTKVAVLLQNYLNTK